MEVLIIAHPSEKGGYNNPMISNYNLTIIAHPSEKGGYNDGGAGKTALRL